MIKAKRVVISVLVLAIVLGVGSVLIYMNFAGFRPKTAQEQASPAESFEPLDPNIKVAAGASKTKENTVILTVTGIPGNVVSLAYELTYESQGLIKGVNSGSKPIDVSGKGQFTREVYLGTCSRNVCKPDLGVSKISVVIEFTNAGGKKSQFSNDYTL